MNMKKIFLCALIFTVVLSFGFAEDNAKDEYFPTAIGFNFHASTGGAQSMGLTYQHWFKNDLGYQFTFGAIMDYDFVYSGDLQLQKLLFVHKQQGKGLTSLFAWGGVGVSSTDVYSDTGDIFATTTKPAILASAGLGIEFIYFNHLSIPLKFGVTGQFLNNPSVAVSFGCGILYRF